MAIIKAIEEAVSTSTEQAVKQTVKKQGRKRIKGMPKEEAIPVRDKDIGFEQKVNVIQQKQVDEKLDQFIDLKIYDTRKSVDPEFEALQEKKRSLYEKAINLKKERETLSILSQKDDFNDGIEELLTQNIGVGKTHSSVESRSTAIYNRISADMTDLKEALRTKVFGMKQDKELMYDMIRYLKDGEVKNPALREQAVKIGDQWKAAADSIKGLRNRAGSRIGTLADWVLPQTHDAVKIKKQGYDAWKEKIRPLLDETRIVEEQEASLEDVLKSAYNNITTRDPETTIPGATSKLSRKHEEMRVLHFKDGDSIIKYQEEFGSPDFFGTMDAHLQQQSREIALMQMLGTNPENTFNKLLEIGRANGMSSLKEGKLRRLYNVASGKVDHNNIVEKADHNLAAWSGGYRALQVGSKLGTALVSALADVGNILLAGGYRNISGIKIFGKGLKIMLQEAVGTGASRDVQLASRIGVVSEFAQASLANSRFSETSAGALQGLASGIIRASGLSSWTNALRSSFGLELAGKLGDFIGKSFDDIPFNKMMEEYGISRADWDSIADIPKKNVDGAEFIDLKAIQDANEEVGYKLSEMIQQEMNAFVVMPTDRVRLYTTAGEQKGTGLGETARNVALFKSFPIAITMLHLNRMGQMGAGGKLAYASSGIVLGAVFGQISLWAHDLVTGKSPRSIDRAAAPMEAILKSGGLGIFGDVFLGEEKSRYGHSWASSLMGVPATTIEDIGKSIIEPAVALATMDKDKGKKSMVNIYNRAKNYIPGQNLWYTRYLMQQTIGNTMGELIDPDFKKKQRRRRKALRTRSQKEYDLF